MTDQQPIFHRNLAGGPAVKGVHCKRCGEYVGLVQGRSGKWYTCQLRRSMSETRISYVAAPWTPHAKTCGETQRRADAERDERERKLRDAIATVERGQARLAERGMEPDPILAESIAVWRKCLVDEGFDRAA